jgi:hypothetical protein
MSRARFQCASSVVQGLCHWESSVWWPLEAVLHEDKLTCGVILFVEKMVLRDSDRAQSRESPNGR